MILPVSISIPLSLFIIIILSRFFKHLHIPILAGCATISILCSLDLSANEKVLMKNLTSENNIFLIIVMVLIITLSGQMSATGFMKKLVDLIKDKVSQRTALAILPAIIGLLPMPGGALFSAPLVDDCDRNNIYPLLKTKINFWFRHIWEYWWPLYPGVLLAIDISGIDTIVFIMFLFPLSIFSVVVGIITLLKKVPVIQAEELKSSNSDNNILELFTLTAPVLIIITIYACIRFLLPALSEYNKYLPMLIGICVAMLYLQIVSPLNIKIWKSLLCSKRLWTLALLVFIVRLYGGFLETKLANGDLLIATMRNELTAISIPTWAVIIILPFICGISTGLAIGFVGASFPIVFMLIGDNPPPNVLISTAVIAYGFGYLGMLLSPVHVCLVVSNQHFKTSLYSSIKKLLIPGFLMAILIILYALILYKYL
jgi:integral membrane protein (TIGR00529 family)